MSTKIIEINGVKYTDTYVDDVLVSTVWVNADGTGRLSRTIDADNENITEITSWTNEGEDESSLTSNYVFDSSGNFLGGTKSENGATYTYNSSWEVTQITYELLLISSDTYASTFGNASDVARLFGSEVGDIQFQITNSWDDESDSTNSGKDVSFFDKDTGTKLGVMYVNNGSWTENGTTILSTNINFESVDENGNQQWLGGSWSNVDSAGELRDSGSNSRTTVAYSTLTSPSGLTLPDDVTLEAATEIIVEAGSNTWRERGETFTSESTRYFVEVGNDLEGYEQIYLWETQTRNGVTTAYDSNWNQVGKPQASLSALTALENAITALENEDNNDQGVVDSAASLELLFGDNLYFLLVNTWQDAQNGNSGKEYSIFDSAGSKLGTMNVNEGSWTDDRTGEEYRSSNIGFNSIDENGNWEWLGGSWKNYDSDGGLRDSGSNTRSTATVDQTFLAGVPSEL
ncbi:hypothetical protein N9L89_06190, partial [Gammaproteobacteria bacterium]|nr:hypothetical protein [Gammaproteobacteria bacterium]